MNMNMLNTLQGSMMEHFFPRGWDLEKIDHCCGLSTEESLRREDFWSRQFTPVSCNHIQQFNVFMGHEIAYAIKTSREEGKELAVIFPVGPMGMYEWAVYFLKIWNIKADHVHGFNMDEWSDADGNTLPPDNPGAFQFAMESAFYGPLGELTVPLNQRNYATKTMLPSYGEKISELKGRGAKLLVVYGIGRACHIAFWEPHFAEEFADAVDWAKQTHRLGARLHPLTIEQNAITSFKSRTTLVPCYANTIGPGLFIQADYAVGGCDGILGRGCRSG